MKSVNPAFWQNKTVLVTGHTGFKGSWLSIWLAEMGAKVVGYSLEPPTQPNLFTLARVSESVTHYLGDIRDYRTIHQVVKSHRPEIAFHLAAQPLVLASYDQPVDTYATNVTGTVHVLEALRQVDSVKAIVNVTTDKCYENKEWDKGYHEEDVLGGHDPYSNSKACSELVTAAYRNSYFNNLKIGLASARAGNVIGGGDWAVNRLIPDIINACAKQQTVAIRNPDSLRPWQHVLEPLKGYLLLAQCLYQLPQDFSSAWNFGPHAEDAKPVKWIVEYVVNKWGHGANWAEMKVAQQHEARYLKLAIDKATTKMGWNPCWDLSTGLEKTIDWYQAYHAGNDMHAVTVKQIQEYMNLCEIKISEAIK